MRVPDFLKSHRPSAVDRQLFEEELRNPSTAKTWVSEVRTQPPDVAYPLLAKALHYEIRYRRRTTVVEDLRGAFNRARGTVERQIIEDALRG